MTLGDQLRRAGLTQNALLAWAGTHRIPQLPEHMLALLERPVTPAATALALFITGTPIPVARAAQLPLAELIAHELIEIVDERVHALVAILPLEHTLVVADRADSLMDADMVCWPDDSSFHLASAIPAGRRERWLDLACGSAVAPLARPGLAAALHGIDLNPRGVRYARLGALLSGVAHLDVTVGDIAATPLRAPLVTCNAPILGDPDAAIWRSTDQAFFDRLWATARRCVEPGGEVIVHCVLDALPALDGEVATVVYTPPDDERAFAVTWWRPDAPTRHALGYRPLTAARPHLDPHDRDAVLAGALAPVGDASV